MKAARQQSSKQIGHFGQVWNKSGITPEVENWVFIGNETNDDANVVIWIPEDLGISMRYSNLARWCVTMVIAFATLTVAFVSSAYSGGAHEIVREFGSKPTHCSVSLCARFCWWAIVVGFYVRAVQPSNIVRHHVRSSDCFLRGCSWCTQPRVSFVLRCLAGAF